MDLLENFDSNMVFMEKAENTMDLLGSVDLLVENLWEAERSYYQHFDLNFPVPVENNIPPCGLWFPAQPQISQAEAYGLTRQHQTTRDVEVIDDDIAIISPNTFDRVCHLTQCLWLFGLSSSSIRFSIIKMILLLPGQEES